IGSLLNLDYPKEKLEIIVVDDKSSDNSVEVARKYSRKYANVRVIVNKRNSGNAAEPTNLGIKAAKYDYIAVADADSTPERDALRKMIGFLQKDDKVGGVTCAVLAREPKNFIQRLQAIEYAVIAWSRKLLDFVDSVYVTPGPFALYKKKVLIEIGMFDTKNMTQDIEIVWRMLSHGYHARMCLATRVYSETPDKFSKWFRQRIRWNIGGKQCMWKYKSLFFRSGMLGAFIIPFFTFSMFLGLFGLGLFSYLFARRFLISYITTRYAIYADSSILHLQDLTFAPSILNFFGAALFFLGMFFTIFGLRTIRLQKSHWGNIFNFLFYSLVYLTVYPFLLLASSYRILRGNYKW
ncbi:MAG TPA: glycosyltransferase family 2 protein, partial [Candidatus Nanoarchaeia archaeon]|nr:glycosyltransferase family 2 protein [Candidatus Nanoarchaeia archaeon]